MSLETPPSISTLACEWAPAASPTGKTLVVLHGRGDSSEGFHWMPRALGFSGLDYLLVNAPDPYFTGYSWYDLPPDQAPGVVRSRRLLDTLFSELWASGRRAEDTALFGFSQGCLMTMEWGLRSDANLAAYVGVSGYALDPAAVLAERHGGFDPARWLITHGRFDDVLPFDTTRAQLAELRRGGLELRFETFDKGHTIDPHDELPLLRGFIAERMGLPQPRPTVVS